MQTPNPMLAEDLPRYTTNSACEMSQQKFCSGDLMVCGHETDRRTGTALHHSAMAAVSEEAKCADEATRFSNRVSMRFF